MVVMVGRVCVLYFAFFVWESEREDREERE